MSEGFLQNQHYNPSELPTATHLPLHKGGWICGCPQMQFYIKFDETQAPSDEGAVERSETEGVKKGISNYKNSLSHFVLCKKWQPPQRWGGSTNWIWYSLRTGASPVPTRRSSTSGQGWRVLLGQGILKLVIGTRPYRIDASWELQNPIKLVSLICIVNV